MKGKAVLAIFAHPDDEAFSPSGTLTLLSKTHDVHLLLVSKGEAGEIKGIKDERKRALIRQNEAKEAAKILGVKSIYFLNFHDGLLCNNHYHQMCEQIEKRIRQLSAEILITFEPRGFSGHLDHVLVSHVSMHVFQKTKLVKEVWFFCIDTKQRAAIPEYYVYFPPGYKRREINKTVDVSAVWEQKLKAIAAHASQKHDAIFYKPMLLASGKKEYFLIQRK